MTRLLLMVVLAAGTASACGDDEAGGDADGGPADASPDDAFPYPCAEADADPGCPDADEIKACGCLNDSSVEFCIPEDAPDVEAALAAIDPEIECAHGGGRAMCRDDQLLCFYPTTVQGGECVESDNSLTDDAWADLCAIAALEEVVEIVATFYE